MRFRHIETDVIELTEILSFGQHLFAIDAKPLFEVLLALRGQIGFAMLCDQGGKNKLRAHNASHAQSGGKVVAAIAFFDVIAEEWNVVAHQGF